jgi:hypothetical protein
MRNRYFWWTDDVADPTLHKTVPTEVGVSHCEQVFYYNLPDLLEDGYTEISRKTATGMGWY